MESQSPRPRVAPAKTAAKKSRAHVGNIARSLCHPRAAAHTLSGLVRAPKPCRTLQLVSDVWSTRKRPSVGCCRRFIPQGSACFLRGGLIIG
jgi:hypothetical protein